MTKLEWCRKYAPEALVDCSDDQLLDIMSTAYESELSKSANLLPALEMLHKISYRTSLGRSTNKLKVTEDIMHSVCSDALSYSSLLNMTKICQHFNSRVKTPDSIERKVMRNPHKEFQSVFNDLLGMRICCEEYPTVFPEYYRVVDMREGKQEDDGYRGIHLYYKESNYHYIIEVQLWSRYDATFNWMSHSFGYKSVPSHVLKQVHDKYEQGLIRKRVDFIKEVSALWNF